MVLLFDLRERYLTIRCMTDEEFDHLQELNSKYVTAWSEIGKYLARMARKYLEDPSITDHVIWVCEKCGVKCKNKDEKKIHRKKTKHETYTAIPADLINYSCPPSRPSKLVRKKMNDNGK